MTLQELKMRPINPWTKQSMEYSRELSEWNIQVKRNRMTNPDGIQTNIYDMTQNKSNEQMLDDARMYIEKNVYTDEQWKQYFIPAINEMIAYNDNFVRWHPGYLIREKKTGKLAILEYDYSTAFGGRDYKSLSICELDENGKIHHSWAWAQYDNYELVDSEHTTENIAKIKEYCAGKNPPYCMCSEMSQMLYNKESTMPPISH